MTNGDDEPDANDADGEESAAADQAPAEEAGAAESEVGSGEDNPTAQEIAADEDTGSDAEEDEPAGEAEEEARLEGDQMEAERADEESTSGDDAAVDAPDEAAAERDETDDESADEAAGSDEEADAGSDDADTDDAPDESGSDEATDEGAEDERTDEAEAEGEETSEDTSEADGGDEKPDTAEEPAEDEETDADESGDDDGDAESEGTETSDDADTDGSDGDDEGKDAESDAVETKHTPESLDERLDDIETRIEEAETETDLDAVEADLDEVEADIEAADLPEPDEEDADDGEEDEETERTREEIESRVTELREAIEAQRGPYAEDVTEGIDGAKTTIAETRWTDEGERTVADAVERFLDDAGEALDEEFAVERTDDADADGEGEVATDGGEDHEGAADEDADDEHGALVAALDDAIDAIESRNLDPDDDEDTIAELVEAAEGLTNDLDDAEEWDDLTVREKLAAEGFYDVLTAENRKDFPPEWNAIKIYEKRNEPEPILRGLEMFGSDFMEEHCIESLKRLGAPAAFDAMEQRAQRRDKPPIEVLGKIGDDRALDTLHEYIEGESDPGLQKVTLKAIGEIGSADSTQQVADRLVADNETVRSNAARALGLIGDARAIDPLADVLREDDSNSVRASAAWALNQIGTETALDAAREHADDRSYLVQTEAEKAEHAMAEDDTAEQAA